MLIALGTTIFKANIVNFIPLDVCELRTPTKVYIYPYSTIFSKYWTIWTLVVSVSLEILPHLLILILILIMSSIRSILHDRHIWLVTRWCVKASNLFEVTLAAKCMRNEWHNVSYLVYNDNTKRISE